MNKLKWGAYGFLFGMIFPAIAMLFRLNHLGADEYFEVIFTAPIFLGIFAFFAGIQNDKLVDLHKNLESLIEKRTKELTNLQSSYEQAIKMAALGEMTGGIAHELNTPLAIISMNADRLKDNLEGGKMDAAIIDKSLNAISKTVDRMAEIINKLRNFSTKTNLGEINSNEVHEIKLLLENSVLAISEKLLQFGVELTIDAAENEWVNIPSREFSQVIFSLIDNSIYAVKDLKNKWIRIRVSSGQNNVHIYFEDSGTGIPAENISKIFQPFFTTREVGQGMGLGLSSSQGIMRAYGGTLEYVQNEITTFLITLPKVNLSKGA